MMEHQEQLEKETEEAINAINKKTGRNMPQAIATGAVLVILILACLLISIDLFVYLVVLFMVLALCTKKQAGSHPWRCCGYVRRRRCCPPITANVISSP